jgi:signal transduction histidine kinase
VSNALKYSDRGGHVELQVRATAGAVEFAVSDDGPGVTPEARERLFQRFGQVGGDSQRPGGGWASTSAGSWWKPTAVPSASTTGPAGA